MVAPTAPSCGDSHPRVRLFSGSFGDPPQPSAGLLLDIVEIRSLLALVGHHWSRAEETGGSARAWNLIIILFWISRCQVTQVCDDHGLLGGKNSSSPRTNKPEQLQLAKHEKYPDHRIHRPPERGITHHHLL